MNLQISTPLGLVLDVDGVQYVRAEDPTGLFGVLRGHADLLTVLSPSVLSWRGADGAEHHVAVRGGVLTVRGGERVAVATREAVTSDDLDALEGDVVARFRADAGAEERARTTALRLEAAAIGRIAAALRGRPHSGRSVPGEEQA